MDGNGPVVEFNGLSAHNGEADWLTTWFKSLKPLFLQKQDDYRKVNATGLIGGLYLESLEVVQLLHFTDKSFEDLQTVVNSSF